MKASRFIVALAVSAALSLTMACGGAAATPDATAPLATPATDVVLTLEAGVSELGAGRLTVGMPAEVIVQARSGERYKGELAAIAPEVNQRNRHFPFVNVGVVFPARPPKRWSHSSPSTSKTPSRASTA